MGKNMIILGADFSVNGIDGHALFDNSTWFNGYWAASGTSANTTSGNTYLTCYFIALPEAGESWTLTPKAIDGYLVGMRPYVCRTLDGTTPQTFTRSDNTYGDVSGASSRTLSTDTIKALDSNAAYFAVCLYANPESGSGGGMSLTSKEWTDLITVTKD